MKSGLWILVVVLVAAVAVGTLLRPRLQRLVEEQEPPEASALARIENLEDPENRLERLRDFISEHPESRVKHEAYRLMARAMLNSLGDTLRFLGFAESTLAQESDPESRAEIYYGLYNVRSASDSSAALGVAYRLLSDSLDVSWINNYIGYDLAEKGYGLDVALGLCQRALRFADSRPDSAGIMDSRGWVYYKMGLFDEAMADLETAAALFDFRYEEVLRHLAYAALRAGKGEKAFETLKTILVMGEYAYARAALDSLMDARAYSPEMKAGFEESIWEERIEAARPGDAFTLPALAGAPYEFDPLAGRVAVINFMSPT
jgi:tetratricopeptide (TPR) repeat protein